MQEKIRQFLKMRERTLSFFGQNQYNDWKIVLIIIFVGFLLVSSFGWFFYQNIGDDVDYFGSGSNTKEVKKIKKEVLTTMIGRMEERQKNFDELVKNKPFAADPSI